tara:strand:- start:250 stop:984 length:735 start_codon:yes stop_codon:yes gene_type:complete
MIDPRNVIIKMYWQAHGLNLFGFRDAIGGKLSREAQSFQEKKDVYSIAHLAQDEELLSTMSVSLLSHANDQDELNKLYCFLANHHVESPTDFFEGVRNLYVESHEGYQALCHAYQTAFVFKDEVLQRTLEDPFVGAAKDEDLLESLFTFTESLSPFPESFKRRIEDENLDHADTYGGLRSLYNAADHFENSEFAERIREKIYEVGNIKDLADFYLVSKILGEPRYWEISREQMKRVPLVGRLFR